jgi:protein TonB
MAFRQLNRKNRAAGIAGAIAVNALLIAGLFSLSNGISPLKSVVGFSAFDLSPPPPPAPPPPDKKPAGASAPTSRGATKAPSPPNPPHPLPSPTPAKPSLDSGSEAASGAGSAAGSGAGQGGQGKGTGAGGNGSGNGSGMVSQPVHIAGDITDRDFRRAGGAAGQVVVSIRVRSDGRVDNCRVARSSGSPVIDASTCSLIEQRYRFRPARNAAGQAVDSEIQWQANWNRR